MKQYRLYQVDAFTKERFRGNPAGVVPNADGLTEADMRKIAREMNNSETAFIFSSASPDYDVEVRFFTPSTEVPLCGHATIAAHYVRAVEGSHTSGRIVQKTKAGLLPVEIVSEKDGDYSVVMTQGKPIIESPMEKETVSRIVKALGITADDLRNDCPVAIASAGHSKVMVGIQSREQLHALVPDLAALSAISGEIGCNGYYVFTLHPDEETLVHGRMFAPAIGIAEDPVTGNANGPLGAYMVHYGICQELADDAKFDFKIMQGEAIGREGTMRVHIGVSNGAPTLVQIMGQAVIVFSAAIAI